MSAAADTRAARIRGDLFGGLTAGVVALPLALAFGVASGLDTLTVDGVPLNGALAGLLGAIAVGFFAAAFGGTPAQISGPTGPMTVVAAGFIATHTGDPRWLFAAIALAGLLQILLGVLKVGRWINYIPYPVISGFMTGIGVIIVLLQIPQAFGAPAIGSPVEALKAIPVALGDANVAAVGVAAGTIAIIYLMPRITKVVPGTLVALIVMTVAAYAVGLDVPKLGDIPSGRPQIVLSSSMDLSHFSVILAPAAILAVLGSIDSLLTSLVADQITKTKHDSDKELVGQGLGNFVAGLFGGLPGAGATMRTVINVRSGGRGRLAGIIHSVFLLAVLLGLGPLAAEIPHPVLAGILITVGIGIVDYKGLAHLVKVPRADAAIMVAVLVLTVAVDLITAVGVGMVMASILLVKRLADEDAATRTPLQEMATRLPGVPELDLPDHLVNGVHVVELEGSLFFGNAGILKRRLRALIDEQAVVLDLSKVPFIDQSGAYALAELFDDLDHEGSETLIVLAGVRDEPRGVLARLGIAPGPHIPAERLAPDVPAAVAVATEALKRAAEQSSRAERSEPVLRPALAS